MRRAFPAVIILSLFILAGLMQNPSKVSSAPPFGGPEDVKDSEQLWKALSDARLVGNQSITAMPYKGSVHKTILITLDSTLRLGDHTGTVIVKKMFQGPEVSVQRVFNDPTTDLKIVAVMYKREKGYDPDNQDWFYTKYNPDGRPQKNQKGMLMTGRVGKCMSCHQSAPGDDYVYSYDR